MPLPWLPPTIAAAAAAALSLLASAPDAAAAAGGPATSFDFDRLYEGGPPPTQAAPAGAPPNDAGAGGAGATAPPPKRPTFQKILKEHSGKQNIEVLLNTEGNSKSLYLDRALQLTDLGEHMYHEMMAHVPLLTVARAPETVLVIGAGDGGVSLRVLEHPSVKKLVQVELDQKVIDVSRLHFPQLARAYDDPRMRLYIEDAIAWVQREAPGQEDSFDAVIIDSTDEPLISLWSKEFYMGLRRLLKPGGVLMQNAQSLDVPIQMEHLLRLMQQGGFERVRPVFIGSNDYESPYVAFLSSDLETPCPGPAPGVEDRANALKASWYSLAMHRAALVAPPGMVRRWPEFDMTATGCHAFFHVHAGRVASADATGSAAAVAAAAGADGRGSAATSSAEAGQSGAVEEKGKDAAAGEGWDVVIVGGGFAGVSAAHMLTRHLGLRRVLLLEAKDKLGGRVETTDPETFGGAVANLGANWIHFAGRNPLLRLAERFGCPTAPSWNGNLKWYAKGLGELSEESMEEARKFAADVVERMRTSPPEPGASAAAWLTELAGKDMEPPNATSRAARHLQFFGDIIQDHTAMTGDVSSQRLCTGVCGGDEISQDRHVTGERGSLCFLDGLIDESPRGALEVRLDSVVSEVRLLEEKGEGSGVEVVFARRGAADGKAERIRAKAVVVAAPLGILHASVAAAAAAAEGRQAGKKEEGPFTFKPDLSSEWTKLWFGEGLGQSLRAALLFDQVFWDSSVEFFSFLFDQEVDASGRQTAGGWFYGEPPAVEFTSVLNNTGRPILLAEVGTHLADKLQSRSDEEIGAFLVDEALKAMFPKAEVPRPLAVKAKRYRSDPFARQALTYPTATKMRERLAEAASAAGSADAPSDEAEDEIRRWLRIWQRPHWDGRLVFAGEHASTRMGTLDGALFSGIQAAFNIACAVSGGRPPLTPIQLLRSIGIFGDWYPQRTETRRCIEAFAARGWILDLESGRGRHAPGRRSSGTGRRAAATPGEASSPCAAHGWFDDLELECRFAPERPPGPMVRHCLDQGD